LNPEGVKLPSSPQKRCNLPHHMIPVEIYPNKILHITSQPTPTIPRTRLPPPCCVPSHPPHPTSTPNSSRTPQGWLTLFRQTIAYFHYSVFKFVLIFVTPMFQDSQNTNHPRLRSEVFNFLNLKFPQTFLLEHYSNSSKAHFFATPVIHTSNISLTVPSILH